MQAWGVSPRLQICFWQWQSCDPLDLVDTATWCQISTDILEFRRILACWDLELDLRICDMCDICTSIAEFVTDLVALGSFSRRFTATDSD
jgi:hypothetical protein